MDFKPQCWGFLLVQGSASGAALGVRASAASSAKRGKNHPPLMTHKWGVPRIKCLLEIRQQARSRWKQTAGGRAPAVFLIVYLQQGFAFLADGFNLATGSSAGNTYA